MNLTDSLCITAKGVDELKHRTYKLGMKKRSVLILLEVPRMVQYLIEKAVLPQAEVFSEVQSLVSEGFVTTASAGEGAAPVATSTSSVSGSEFAFSDDIILPEAKFMLIDFCTDHFPSRAEVLAGEIRACQSPRALSAYLVGLVAFVDKHHPAQAAGLRAVIKEIRDTL